jgi:protein-tyrosine phosphatase
MADTIRNLGGMRSTARVFGHTVLGACGLYRQYQRVDWDQVQRLVFVCSGNICRSPYAAERARSQGIAAISFGVDARGGAGANAAAIRLAQEAGLDLGRHVSMRATDYQSAPGDLLLAMEPLQLAALQTTIGRNGVQASLLGLWCRRPLPFLPDPYGNSDGCFRHVFSLIDTALASVRVRLKGVGEPQPATMD